MFSPNSLELKPSGHLLVGSIVLCVACLYALWQSALSIEWQLPGYLITLIIMFFSAYRDVLRKHRYSLQSLYWTKHSLLAINNLGHTVELKVSHTSFIHPWLTVLIVHSQHSVPDALLITRDSCKNKEDFRRLRVWLKYNRHSNKQP